MGIKADFSDVVEPRVMDADTECEVRIIDCRYDNDKNGNPYLLPRFEVVGEVGVKDFTKFYALPNDEMEPKRLNNVKWQLLTFFKAFGIDPDTEFEPEDLVGLTAYAILGVGEDNPEFGEQNYIKRFITEA